MKRLLITGAAGSVGSAMRTRLAHLAETIRLSDVAPMEPAGPNEEVVPCDLSDGEAVKSLVEGCDGILHLGGRSIEDKWSVIRSANIDGVYNLYEAAHANGNPRIVFASSNHAIGFYKQTDQLNATSATRPDGLYGVSKVFGEAMASMYHDKYGIETACVRIGACFLEPRNHRMLSTWISYDDFVRLMERVFTVPYLGCPIIYGVSDNDRGWWDNSAIGYLGWQPQDNAETFRDAVAAAAEPPAANAPDVVYQGGTFTSEDIHRE